MIQLKTWVTNLMKLCARKDKSNTFLEPQEIENKLTITNSLISKNSIPSESTTGTVDSVEFRDATKNLLGAIECYRTLAEDLGIRLKLGSNYLGFRVSDEGIPTSFVNHPYDNGPDTQIATVKKVIDSVNQLRTELEPVITAEINQAIDVALEALGADLNRIIAVLSKIGWDFDSTPTQNSIHGITSGGVYSFIDSRLNTLRTELIESISTKVLKARPNLGSWRRIWNHQSGSGSHYFATGGFVSITGNYENSSGINIDGQPIAYRSAHGHSVVDTLIVPVPAGSTATWYLWGSPSVDPIASSVFIAEYA